MQSDRASSGPDRNSFFIALFADRVEVVLHKSLIFLKKLLELDILSEYANAFFIMSRVPGLIAHIFEEQTMQKKMRRIDPVNHVYTGEEPRTVI